MCPGDRLRELKAGGKAAVARALALLESDPCGERSLSLLDAAWQADAGAVIGITGPPGVGKSTLVSRLVRKQRAAGRRVAVLAVDPSSRRSGGALLGDRTRLDVDAGDQGLFVRSMAARDRLGGLSDLCVPGAVLMASLYDRVLIETVGIGQSESEVRDLADLVVLAVQPGAGDSLQFMKAGIGELPDLLAVTKSDLGEPAARTLRELEAVFGLRRPEERVPVFAVSAASGDGMEELVQAIEEGLSRNRAAGRGSSRELRGEALLRMMVRERFGRYGLELLDRDPGAARQPSPFRRFLDFCRHHGLPPGGVPT